MTKVFVKQPLTLPVSAKKVKTSPACLDMRAFQSCHGGFSFRDLLGYSVFTVFASGCPINTFVINSLIRPVVSFFLNLSLQPKIRLTLVLPMSLKKCVSVTVAELAWVSMGLELSLFTFTASLHITHFKIQLTHHIMFTIHFQSSEGQGSTIVPWR